jgi:DNA-binding response OmpR family regulator
MVCTQTPAEIMAWLVARKFDVYVVDSNMSGASALGICCTIRAVDKEGAVICLSPDDDDRETLLNAGADLFLKMPDGAMKLRRVLDDLLDSPKSDSVH